VWSLQEHHHPTSVSKIINKKNRRGARRHGGVASGVSGLVRREKVECLHDLLEDEGWGADDLGLPVIRTTTTVGKHKPLHQRDRHLEEGSLQGVLHLRGDDLGERVVHIPVPQPLPAGGAWHDSQCTGDVLALELSGVCRQQELAVSELAVNQLGELVQLLRGDVSELEDHGTFSFRQHRCPVVKAQP